jgi:serine-type D-Ala-D-Ala carboxypeptidase (penicillin-binding protein 5/6)
MPQQISRITVHTRFLIWFFTALFGFLPTLQAFLSPETPLPSSLSNCKAALVMETTSGEIIFEHNIHDPVYPASMVKMMLILITVEKVKTGDISFDDVITVSAAASKIGGSQVFLKHNETFTLQELFESVLIQSANDSSHAIAEHIAGSHTAFVDIMNLRASQLGMTGTVFHSPHGLPPGQDRDADISTAYDLAILARELVTRHPEILQWTSMDTKPFRDGTFIMTNTNRLLRQMQECDGLKTGYYRNAGFSITATAGKDGVRIIAVVAGCDKGQERFSEAARLLKWGLSLFKHYELITPGFPIDTGIPVINGSKQVTRPVAQSGVRAVIPKDRVNDIIMKTTLERELTAPVEPGLVCGNISFFLDEHDLGSSPLVTIEAIEALSWWGKLKQKVGL